MSMTAVRASVDVAVDSQTAFRIFTQEIDSWWLRGPQNFYDAKRATGMRFEAGVGGRYLEIYDDAAGEVLQIARITVWEPGSRLVWRCSLDDTEIDVRFVPTASGTRVELEQRLVQGAATQTSTRAGITYSIGFVLSLSAFNRKLERSSEEQEAQIA